jgi:hypothetical protein
MAWECSTPTKAKLLSMVDEPIREGSPGSRPNTAGGTAANPEGRSSRVSIAADRSRSGVGVTVGVSVGRAVGVGVGVRAGVGVEVGVGTSVEVGVGVGVKVGVGVDVGVEV